MFIHDMILNFVDNDAGFADDKRTGGNTLRKGELEKKEDRNFDTASGKVKRYVDEIIASSSEPTEISDWFNMKRYRRFLSGYGAMDKDKAEGIAAMNR